MFLTREDSRVLGKSFALSEGTGKLAIGKLKNKLILGDCVAGMKRLRSGCIDLVFADPPYNKGKDFGNSSDRMKRDTYLSWTDTWIKEAKRILKDSGSIYVCSGWEYSGDIQRIISRYFVIRNRITWKREKGRGSKTNWKNNMEDIWFATAGTSYTFNVDKVKLKKEVIAPYRVNGLPKDWVQDKGTRYRYTHPSNIWTDMVVPFWSMRENTPHPTQKPEKLLERIILASSNTSNMVLDPFLGSGTTAVVARRLKRAYIGFELNEDYLKLAMKRLKYARSPERGK
ncbi:MAG: DNA methyltransferase [bacterium]